MNIKGDNIRPKENATIPIEYFYIIQLKLKEENTNNSIEKLKLINNNNNNNNYSNNNNKPIINQKQIQLKIL